MMDGHSTKVPPRMLVAYGGVGLAGTLLGSLFGTYQLQLFLEVYNVPESWFYFGHLIYAVWNTANDLAGGWYGDKQDVHSRRIPLVRWFGIGWVLSFLLAWFASPSWPGWLLGIHFILVMSLIDGCYSVTAIAQGGILVDLTISDKERVKMLFVQGLISTICRVPFVYFGAWFWDKSNITQFRGFAVFTAVLCAVVFYVSTMYLSEVRLPMAMKHSKSEEDGESIEKSSYRDTATVHRRVLGDDVKLEERKENSPKTISILQFARQILRHGNMIAFVSMNFLQESMTIFNSQFLPVFLDLICARWTSHDDRAWIIAICSFLSSVLSLALNAVILKWGVYSLFRTTFHARTVGGVIVLGFGLLSPDQPSQLLIQKAFIIAFIIFNTVITNVSSSGFQIAMSDLIDEDQVVNRRDHSMAGMYYASNALVCKPGNSIFPMLGAWFLSLYGYMEHNTTTVSGPLSTAAFYLLVLLPLVCSIIQSVLWRNYKLRDDNLAIVKHKLAQREYDRITIAKKIESATDV